MQLLRGLQHQFPKGVVATIGNFDGMHLGHQAMLARTLAAAKQQKLPALVVSFEPSPAEYFQQQQAPARLMPWREKYQYLADTSIDALLLLKFNARLAQLSPRDFVEQVLLDTLHVKHLIIGDDFRFGYQRAGDFHCLQTMGVTHGFSVEKTSSVLFHQRRVSSSWVRECLAEGDLSLAQQLLGRPYRISGRVKHGHKRGRSIGVPTANLHIKQRIPPLFGVYAVKVYDQCNTLFHGVANLGVRPTLGGTRALLEVHLFDFDRDIYGEHLRVEFFHKLRDEKRYADFEQLKQQIYRDIATAKNCFFLI